MRATPKEIKHIALNRFTFANNTILSSWVIDKGNNPNFEVLISHTADEMIMAFSKDVYGQKKIMSKEKHVSMPKDWFNHLKMTLGMKYSTKNIPVKFEIEQYALFPEFVDNKDSISYTVVK